MKRPARCRRRSRSSAAAASRSSPTGATRRRSKPHGDEPRRGAQSRISAGSAPATMWRCSPISSATPRISRALQRLRRRIRDRTKAATCLGFGPRFLHSTGQAYKGGPNSGVFLQITCEDAADLPVPGQKYTFGVVKAAQARGDFDVLAERGRRALARPFSARSRRRSATLWPRAIDEALDNNAVDAAANRGDFDATRDDRARPDGRQHRPAADAGRAWLRRLRQKRRGRARPRRRRGGCRAATSAISSGS